MIASICPAALIERSGWRDNICPGLLRNGLVEIEFLAGSGGD